MFKFRSKTDKAETINLNIPPRVVVRTVAVVIAAMIVLGMIHQAAHALVLVFTGFFLALALNGPVHWLAQRIPGKRKGSRVVATAVSFFVVIAMLAAFLFSIVPPLIKQTSNFVTTVPNIVHDLRQPDSAVGKLVNKYHLEGQIDKSTQQISSRLGNIGEAALSSVSKIGSSVFSVLTILVLTFMMLIEGPGWIRFFRDMIPDEHQDRADRLAGDMYRVVKGYVNGQVVLALIASLMLLPALLVLHISYPAALIVVVFICGLIPLVGHTIGAIIVTTVALFNSPWTAVIILAYYILYQQIENYIIQPRIQSNTTNMSPLLVFTSVIIGVNFGGLFGGLVAIPVVGCIRIAVLDYLRTKRIIKESTYEDSTGEDDPATDSKPKPAKA